MYAGVLLNSVIYTVCLCTLYYETGTAVIISVHFAYWLQYSAGSKHKFCTPADVIFHISSAQVATEDTRTMNNNIK